jgi:hypothetical protein
VRARDELEHPGDAHGLAPKGPRRSAASRWSAASLGVLLATVRLVVLSAVGLLGAVFALLPVALVGGPSGRRVARLPAAVPVGPAPSDADFVGRRAGELGRR